MRPLRALAVLVSLVCVLPGRAAPPATAVISSTSDIALDSPASGVAWFDADHLVLAGQAGVRLYGLKDGRARDLIDPLPVPDGLPDPLEVSTDGKSVIAINGFLRSQYALRVSDRKRLLARSNPSFMVIDAEIAGDTLYVLGWPADHQGALNPDGVAVWCGPVTPYFQKLLPFHRLQGGAASIAIFNDSIPGVGGAMAVEEDGTVDVLTAAEAGVFQYDRGGRQLRVLGAELQELVQPRMHDINFTYGTDAVARYRKVINAQPAIDGLVATSDGPAIVVRFARHDVIEWELWYPSPSRTRATLRLGVTRQGPFGHLACSARGRELACVYQQAKTPSDGLQQDPANLVTHLVRFHLPTVSASRNKLAAR